jgi:hypothetical protein
MQREIIILFDMFVEEKEGDARAIDRDSRRSGLCCLSRRDPQRSSRPSAVSKKRP